MKTTSNFATILERPEAAIGQAFVLHRPCHAHHLQEFGIAVDPAGLHPSFRKPAAAKP